MVSAVGVNVPQGLALTVAHSAAHGLKVAQGAPLAVFNVPTKHLRADQARVDVAYRKVPTEVRATQMAVMAVVDGRVAQPNVRAFTFTLDGHDFYGLRLGDTSTLLYDVSSKEWIEWGSDPMPFWRVNCAMNWIGAQSIGYQNGNTDIVCGDDTWGLLYFLDPTQAWDDYPDDKAVAAKQQVPFTRIAMSQTTVSGRTFQPCYSIFLDSDNYGITANSFTPFVMLETSDDQGKSWINHGTINVNPGDLNENYRWYSLGQIQAPGRLFRITDNGILTRIDSLVMNDD